MGIEMPLVQEMKDTMVVDPIKKVKCEIIPLNKVGDYCEGDDGNTTLPVEFNEVKSLAILNSGAGVAIATKQVWESWRKPVLRKTRMKLQLTDGFIESPIGLLEKIIVTSYGVEYEHTFAVVDFGKKPNYEIILGRPFIRQLKMIQDWGYNYIYLRQPSATTRIDLRDHSYKDVLNTLVKDMVSTIGQEE